MHSPVTVINLLFPQDGTVRQHDLRTPHHCRTECPAPLIKMQFELSAISQSSLTPYQFVVAGESPYVRSLSKSLILKVVHHSTGIPI